MTNTLLKICHLVRPSWKSAINTPEIIGKIAINHLEIIGKIAINHPETIGKIAINTSFLT